MCVEGRVVLEKIKTMEARLAYQIEKLVRIAKEPEPQQGGATDAAEGRCSLIKFFFCSHALTA